MLLKPLRVKFTVERARKESLLFPQKAGKPHLEHRSAFCRRCLTACVRSSAPSPWRWQPSASHKQGTWELPWGPSAAVWLPGLCRAPLFRNAWRERGLEKKTRFALEKSTLASKKQATVTATLQSFSLRIKTSNGKKKQKKKTKQWEFLISTDLTSIVKVLIILQGIWGLIKYPHKPQILYLYNHH